MDKGTKAVNEALNGEVWRALEAAAPTGLESTLNAIRQSTEGVTTTGGKPILDASGRPITLTTGEAITQAAAFRPARVAEVSQERRVQANTEEYYKDKRDEIYIAARRAKTTDDWREISTMIQRFNMNVAGFRGLIAPITVSSVRRAMRPETSYLEWETSREENQ